jgi:hypothetical protein
MFHVLFSLTLVLLHGVPGLSAIAQQDTPTITPTNSVKTTSTNVPLITPIPETATAQISIQSPSPGQAIQGFVTIIGNIPTDDFQHGELSFSYLNNPTKTWFLIQNINEPIVDGSIAEWDTTTITDGAYNLRLSVVYEDAGDQVIDVTNLRVRNYTPIETNTPTPLTPTVTPVPGSSPTPIETPIPPTATSLPKNPAQLTTADITLGFGKGALVAIGVFALGGLYFIIRKVLAKS